MDDVLLVFFFFKVGTILKCRH